MHEINKIEEEIDCIAMTSPLLDMGRTKSIMGVLSAGEDYFFKIMYLADYSFNDRGAAIDNLINQITYPLRACNSAVERDGGSEEKFLYDADVYENSMRWLVASDDYCSFCTIFPLWRRGLIGLEVNGRNLCIVQNRVKDFRYEAYNRLVENERCEVNSEVSYEELVELARHGIRRVADDYCIDMPLLLKKRIRKYFRAIQQSRYSIPENWDFGKFTLGQIQSVFEAVRVLLFGHHLARFVLARDGAEGLAYEGCVLCRKKNWLYSFVYRETGISREVIKGILSLLTFGSCGLRDPDVALQPLFEISGDRYALSPLLWLNSNFERNVCVLMARVEKNAYLALVNEKEKILVEKVKADLSGLGFEFRVGKIETTDIDLAIIDFTEKCCVAIELKWFIEPAEVRELVEKTEELAKGVRQAKKVKSEFSSRGEKILSLLGISKDYEFISIVASHSWIGFDDVQDDDVPIIKVGHFVKELRQNKSLKAVVCWLKERQYLPRPVSDFTVVDKKIGCGPWTAEWYGIKAMDSGQ